MEETHDLMEKLIRLFILHDPTMGVSDINLKVLEARIARWAHKQPDNWEIDNAINQVLNMSDDHCKDRECFRDCNYWMRCPLAVLTKGPFTVAGGGLAPGVRAEVVRIGNR
ncbi:hypothetical protein CEB3_c19180 [Peptococcaceae bacterium CEB3]|nr:hypothetical protein CEB3_c19180 [Peptococcaceae bacterium CEB3]